MNQIPHFSYFIPSKTSHIYIRFFNFQELRFQFEKRCDKERVVDRLPLMTYGLKLEFKNLEILI